MQRKETVMALRDILAIDASAGSVVDELISGLTETLGECSDGTYDTDAVLFDLALAVVNLSSEVVTRRAEIIELEARLVNLETRILEAGVSLRER
ncbi:hypothetical protein D2E31_03420 [Mycobacteroides abscessus]|nr:hypothetical protein DDJ91_04960 [Mycobacteroides abscessus]RIR36243.1 hypothetical protein D2E31_03420 [Mycobacteroides abscessus]